MEVHRCHCVPVQNMVRGISSASLYETWCEIKIITHTESIDNQKLKAFYITAWLIIPVTQITTVHERNNNTKITMFNNT